MGKMIKHISISYLVWLPSVLTIGWAKLAKSSNDKWIALSPESIREEVSKDSETRPALNLALHHYWTLKLGLVSSKVDGEKRILNEGNI